MSTLIELEEPYKSRWRKGYLQIHPNGRKYICLFNGQNDRSLVSYARYLKSVQLGYFIDADMEVDHEDDNFQNDSVSNLQLLSPLDNLRKEAVYRRGSILSQQDQFCEICNVAFRHKRYRRTCASETCKQQMYQRIGRCEPLTDQRKIEIATRIHGGQSYDRILSEMHISSASITKYKNYKR